MKKLRVKPRKRKSISINYNIKEVITDNGEYSFDDIRFDFNCNTYYQYLYLFKSGIVSKPLCVCTNDFVCLSYKGQCEHSIFDRDLECLIYKYRQLLKGGE